MSNTNCPNPIGPIPAWVREKWQGDKPYPEVSLAQRNAQEGEDATNRRAARELAERYPSFEKSSVHETFYIDRSGGVYRYQVDDSVDAIFSSREKAESHLHLHGYTRLHGADLNARPYARFAYQRAPNQ